MCNGMLCVSQGGICAACSLRENLLFDSLQWELCQSERVRKCAQQLANSTDFVRVGSVFVRSHVPLKVFNVWHFSTVSTVQQAPCCSSAHALCCCIQTGLTQDVSFMSPQQHSGYSRKLNVGCVEHFYKIRSQMYLKLMYWEDDISITVCGMN